MTLRSGRSLAVLTLTAVLMVFGPGGAPEAQDKPRSGGELIFVVAAEPPGFDGHREETFAMLHPIGPHYSTLMRVDPTDKTGHEVHRGPRRVLDGLARQAHLHVQAAPGREVPRRRRDDLEGREGVLRQDRLPAGRHRVEPEGAVQGGRGDRGADARHRRVPVEVSGSLVHRQRVLAVELDLPGRDPRQGPALAREEHQRNGPVQVRRVRARLALGRQEECRLLGQGEAVPRRLPRGVHPGRGGAGRRDPRRARHDPVPRLQPAAARSARAGAGQQDHGSGERRGTARSRWR